MRIGSGKIARYVTGRPHFAIVDVAIDDGTTTPAIQIRCTGTGWIRHGCIETVPADGYTDWKDGARAGVQFALADLPLPALAVTVTKIEGLMTDTNPSIVAAAAASAVWHALGHCPSETVQRHLDHVTFTSWSRDPAAVPWEELGVNPETM